MIEIPRTPTSDFWLNIGITVGITALTFFAGWLFDKYLHRKRHNGKL